MNNAVEITKELVTKGVHTLLFGPPGAGKTYTANSVARELGVPLFMATGEIFHHPLNFCEYANEAGKAGGILFVDEIHTMPRHVQDGILTALEEYRLYLPGLIATIRKFVCIGATTNPDNLLPPLRERFFKVFVDYRSDADMVEIILAIGADLGVKIAPDAVGKIARVSRGIPRRARQIITLANSGGVITARSVDKIISNGIISADGLFPDEIRYLKILADGHPRSIRTIASVMGMGVESVAEIEAVLVRAGAIAVSPRGRMITEIGKELVQVSE